MGDGGSQRLYEEIMLTHLSKAVRRRLVGAFLLLVSQGILGCTPPPKTIWQDLATSRFDGEQAQAASERRDHSRCDGDLQPAEGKAPIQHCRNAPLDSHVGLRH